MKSKNKITKFILSLVIFSILVPTILFAQGLPSFDITNATINLTDVGVNTTSSIANVTDTGISWTNVLKDVAKEILKVAARKALQKMTQSTVNWINSGFHGNPLYLENSDSFFKDIAKYEIKNMVDTFGYNSTRYPFGKDFSLNVINSYKNQLDDNLEYTMSKVITDGTVLKNYQNDFNVGGWNGFLVNTQYPQNNYLGFQMLATEELARKVAGTSQTATEKIKTTLEQGSGFLSPQTCTTNTSYNNGKNEFLQPKFNLSEYTENHPIDWGTATAEEENAWNTALEKAQAEFIDNDTCPKKTDGSSGFAATTPGSVVSSQIMKSLGASQDQASLSAAMGNSLSAVFDALINHFIDKGLNALSSTVTSSSSNNNEDTWDYYGNTLGVASEGGTNDTWGSGVDEEISLEDFKILLYGKTVSTGTSGETITEVGDTGNGTYTAGAIANTQAELKLIYNDSTTNPGIIQMFGYIWPKTRELDICLPGPDLGWEERLNSEQDRNGILLSEKTSDNDPKKAANATIALKELEFAVKYFKDWINNKMMTTLPNSIIYMDTVDELSTLLQDNSEIGDEKQTKAQVLARLQAIGTSLSTLTEEPEADSSEEKILIKLKKQYNAISDSVSNTKSIDTKQSQIDTYKDWNTELNKLIPECTAARLANGWTTTGGRKSTYLDKGTEENLFCDFPIKGGYTHNSFTGPNTTTPELPMVNAKNVMSWGRFGGLFGTKKVNMQLNCDMIYKSSILDYKGDLPGLTTVTESFEELNFGDEDSGGECTRPEDADKHDDPGAGDAIATATAELRAGGMTWDPDSSNQEEFECNRFQILKRAAKILEANGSDVGIYIKPSGNNCEGYSVDIMAFPDGYLYDVLGGGSEGINATWGAASCDPVKPSRYKLASEVD